MKTKSVGVMHGKLLCAVLFLAGGLGALEFGSSAEKCFCPKVKCGPCEISDGLTFYSKKCGDMSQQTKSCSRPKCVDKEPLTKSCLADRQKNKPKKVEQASVKSKVESAEDMGFHSLKHPSRPVGIVKVVKGKAWVRAGKSKKAIKKGMKINEKDLIITAKKSGVRMDFNDGNSLHVTASTEVRIDTVEDKKADRKTMLELLKGRIRNKIRNKYKGSKKSYYRVKTRSAVAGVRGTDFVVDFGLGDKETTKIQTLTGKVELSVLGSDSEALEISEGMYASYVVDASNSVFNEEEINDFVASGYMTPVYKLSDKEISRLDWDTEIREDNSQRDIASSVQDDFLCQAPAGKFNQCSWACSKGSSKTKGTACNSGFCFRRRCNANGQWADSIRIPDSKCKAVGDQAGSCDY